MSSIFLTLLLHSSLTPSSSSPSSSPIHHSTRPSLPSVLPPPQFVLLLVLFLPSSPFSSSLPSSSSPDFFSSSSSSFYSPTLQIRKIMCSLALLVSCFLHISRVFHMRSFCFCRFVVVVAFISRVARPPPPFPFSICSLSNSLWMVLTFAALSVSHWPLKVNVFGYFAAALRIFY